MVVAVAAMEFASPDALRARGASLGPGPVCLIACEDGVEVAGSLRHHLRMGWRAVPLALPPGLEPHRPLPERARRPPARPHPRHGDALRGRPVRRAGAGRLAGLGA